MTGRFRSTDVRASTAFHRARDALTRATAAARSLALAPPARDLEAAGPAATATAPEQVRTRPRKPPAPGREAGEALHPHPGRRAAAG